MNIFLKTYLKIITEGFTDGIYPLAFDSRLTDNFTDGHNPTVFYSACHNDRWIYRRRSSVGIPNIHRQFYRRF